MGLDMYIFTASKGLAEHMYVWHVNNGYWGEEYDNWRPTSGVIAYWRKANHIHNWLVQNVQSGNDDCGDYSLSISDMENLVDVCDKVLEARSETVSRELLPTTAGFFFGSTQYDDWYYDEIEYTKDVLEEILRNVKVCDNRPYCDYIKFVGDDDWDARIVYCSSW